jgi:hypothetical protein
MAKVIAATQTMQTTRFAIFLPRCSGESVSDWDLLDVGVTLEQGNQDLQWVQSNNLLEGASTANYVNSHIEKQIIEKNNNEKALQKLKSLGGWLS